MVLKSNAPALPKAAMRNPYSQLSRPELDAALDETIKKLATLDAAETIERRKVEKRRRQILDSYLWLLVREGKASWSGAKPQGSQPPIEITPGPPISDYVIEDRVR